MSEATPRICSRTSSAARCTAEPPSAMLRLPLVPPPCCTRSVSPCTTVICSIGMLSASETICANPVASPWPCGDVPVTTVARPVLVDAHGAELPRTERADLDVARDPDADEPPLRARGLLVGAEARVLREAQRLVERLRVLPAVVLRAARRRVRKLRRRDEVAPPDLGGIDAGRVRHERHRALEIVGRLRPAGAAVRAGGAGRRSTRRGARSAAPGSRTVPGS